tara:strand:+ start:246 stop:1004 length:759 start_codon:yes stop_codon:yes gene_type:complete
MEHYYEGLQGFWGGLDASFYSEMVERFNSGSHFVEVGSFKGKSSSCMAEQIISSGKDIRFDCVDTWAGSQEHQRGGIVEDNNVVDGDLFEVFLENTKRFSDVIKPVRLPSKEASMLYDEESLDFVFIDAAHDMRNVLADVASWTPKVKKGGIIAGHDYGGGWIGVTDAVDLYFKDVLQVEVQVFEKSSCWFVDRSFDVPTGKIFEDGIARRLKAWENSVDGLIKIKSIEQIKKEKEKTKRERVILWKAEDND